MSGYDINDEGMPSLDSINLHTRHQIINTIETITIEKIIKQKPKKWRFGVGTGVGYGVFKHETDVYVGFFAGYTF